MSHERGDLPRGYNYVDGRTGLMGYEYVDPRTGIGSIRYGPPPKPKRKKTARTSSTTRRNRKPDSARFAFVDARTGIQGTGRLGSSWRNEYGEEADSGNEYASSDLGFLGIKSARFKVNKKSFTRPLKSVAKYAPVAAAGLIPIPGVGQLLRKVPIIGTPITNKVDSVVSTIFGRNAPSAAPAPLPAGVQLQQQATPDGGTQVVAVDSAGAVVSKPIPSAAVIAAGLPVIASVLPVNQPQAAAPAPAAAPSVDSGGSALDTASNVLSFADKLKARADAAAQTIKDVESQAAGYADRAASVLQRGGEVVQAATNAGVATAGTGDATSGQLVGALMANPMLLLAAGLGTYVLFKASGPSSRRRR